MTADSQWALQQVIYSTLRADATLKTLTGADPARVFDHVPQTTWEAPNASGIFPPYVVVGETEAREWDTKTEDGMEQTLMVHTWSRGRGMKEPKQIMGAIVDALDQVALSVTGHDLVQFRFEFSETFLEDDGLTRHGVQRFRALTEAA